MIERKPSNRLGINGPAEVKSHPWIRNFPWQKLIKKELQAPFLPVRDKKFFEKIIIILFRKTRTTLTTNSSYLLKMNRMQKL
jgi:hypothetical protein